MSKKHSKSGKGKLIRPCHVCGEPVNFILWVEQTKLRNKRIFHWANSDSSHHVHKDVLFLEKQHLREIMNE